MITTPPTMLPRRQLTRYGGQMPPMGAAAASAGPQKRSLGGITPPTQKATDQIPSTAAMPAATDPAMSEDPMAALSPLNATSYTGGDNRGQSMAHGAAGGLQQFLESLLKKRALAQD